MHGQAEILSHFTKSESARTLNVTPRYLVHLYDVTTRTHLYKNGGMRESVVQREQNV